MKQLKNFNFVWLFAVSLLFIECGDDDNGSGVLEIEIPELIDQTAIDDPAIIEYLETHFYNEEDFLNPPEDFDFQIRFDTIAFENANRTPLISQVTSRTINRNEVDQTIYILSVREGSLEQEPVNFTDSTLVTFKGSLLTPLSDGDQDRIPDFADIDIEANQFDADGDGDIDQNDLVLIDTDGDGIIDSEDADIDGVSGTDEGVVDVDNDGIIDNSMGVFDNAISPIWFDLTATIDGFQQGIDGSFRPSSGFEVNADGTSTFEDDFGIGAIFIPSGLGFFSSPPPDSGIPLFSNLIFTFNVLQRRITDHDGDGVISIEEDLNSNNFLFDADDNTDGDMLANFVDPDDDNDAVLTRLEIVLDENGDFVSFIDTDGDGISDFLDDDDDNDGTLTVDEVIVIFGDNGLFLDIIFTDTDGDGTPDYLDPDS